MFFILLSLPLNIFIGRATNPTNFSCIESNFHIQFTYSSASHSAWQPSLDCSLSSCVQSLNNSYSSSCLSTSISCFDYRTINNVSYCAPPSSCSILEPCDNITNECVSNTSVCVINSCCIPRAVCLPLLWVSVCRSVFDTYNSTSEYLTLDFLHR